MKDVFETVINAPQSRIAEFYANPENNTKWMDDIQKVDFISGDHGAVGSKYRLVPKKGSMVFVATVLSKDMPYESVLKLEASNVDVLVNGKFIAISKEKTKFISEEKFLFKGFFNKIFGMLATGAIRKAHRKHMNAFVEAVKNIK